MPSSVDIANLALTRIGSNRIESFTEGTNEANVMNTLYDETRRALLRSNTWNFAVKRVKLAQEATDPVYEFDHAYTLPSDWLRVLKVDDNDQADGTLEYAMANGKIEASVDEMWLRYIADIEDPNAMTSDFREYLAWELAAQAAPSLTHSNTLAERMAERAETARSRALGADAVEDYPRQRPRGSWVTRRWPSEDLWPD